MRTESEEQVWQHFNAAFAKANEAFVHADKAFAAADKMEARAAPGTVQKLNFEVDTFRQRRQLAWKWFKMAWAILIHGKATLSFKNK